MTISKVAGTDVRRRRTELDIASGREVLTRGSGVGDEVLTRVMAPEGLRF